MSFLLFHMVFLSRQTSPSCQTYRCQNLFFPEHLKNFKSVFAGKLRLKVNSETLVGKTATLQGQFSGWEFLNCNLKDLVVRCQTVLVWFMQWTKLGYLSRCCFFCFDLLKMFCVSGTPLKACHILICHTLMGSQRGSWFHLKIHGHEFSSNAYKELQKIISVGCCDWLTSVVSSFPNVSSYTSGRSGRQQWNLGVHMQIFK